MNIYYKVDVLLIYMKRRNVEFQKRRKNINRKILLIIAIIFSIGICAYTSVNLHFLLSKDFESMLNLNLQDIIKILFTDKRILLIFIILETIVITFLLLFTNKTKNIYHSKTYRITMKSRECKKLLVP